MKIDGTRAAFAAMLKVKGVHNILGESRFTVSNYRKYLKEGRSISLDKMEEMLLRYGAKVVKEKQWKLPNYPYNTPKQ